MQMLIVIAITAIFAFAFWYIFVRPGPKDDPDRMLAELGFDPNDPSSPDVAEAVVIYVACLRPDWSSSQINGALIRNQVTLRTGTVRDVLKKYDLTTPEKRREARNAHTGSDDPGCLIFIDGGDGDFGGGDAGGDSGGDFGGDFGGDLGGFF